MSSYENQKKYIEAWTRTQIEIWMEQIERLKVVRSGALHESFKSRITEAGEATSINLKFLEYGIYQALGVGYGYARDNGGDLAFLDPVYREENRLDIPRKVGPAWGGYKTSGEPRERRDWFSSKLYMSVMALREALAGIYAEEAATVICEQLVDIRAALS